MNKEKSIWERMGLQDWLLRKNDETPTVAVADTLTPNTLYTYIVQKFSESMQELSFANRVVFYHEYIVCFNRGDYASFMDSKRGLFGLIVQECITQFYKLLKESRAAGKTVQPSSSKWVFRFVAHPDYEPGDLGFIGKLLPGAQGEEQGSVRMTVVPRQTGIAQTFDINRDILKDFYLYSDGYFEVPFREEGSAATGGQTTTVTGGGGGSAVARLEAHLPDKAFAGKKLTFQLRTGLSTVTGAGGEAASDTVFAIPSDWVSTPHLRIRHDAGAGTFKLASFGDKTVLNEKEVPRSTPEAPQWTDLPLNSRIMLNGIVGINIFSP